MCAVPDRLSETKRAVATPRRVRVSGSMLPQVGGPPHDGPVRDIRACGLDHEGRDLGDAAVRGHELRVGGEVDRGLGAARSGRRRRSSAAGRRRKRRRRGSSVRSFIGPGSRAGGRGRSAPGPAATARTVIVPLGHTARAQDVLRFAVVVGVHGRARAVEELGIRVAHHLEEDGDVGHRVAEAVQHGGDDLGRVRDR